MTTRAEVVAEARKWLKTPFAHQARARGIGTDCGGLVGGVPVALGLLPSDWWQRVFDPIFGGYGRLPSNSTLRRVCESFLDEIDPSAMRPGDVPLMRFDYDPQHVGILANYAYGGLSIVHALSTVGAVREHRLAEPWRTRVIAAYAYRGIEG